MSLFQPKIIEKAQSKQQASIPEAHLTILHNWKESIESCLLQSQNEVAVHAPFTQNIMVGVLGYVNECDMHVRIFHCAGEMFLGLIIHP